MRRDAVAPVAELASSGRARPAVDRFRRLVDTGVRLNELRSAEEMHEFIVDELT
jgi:hypothetical protein